FSQPAEAFVPQLNESADFIFSINVLDHCYNFSAIASNLFRYLKPGAMAFLSFDSHFTISVGHPLVLTEPTCTRIFEGSGFSITKFQRGFGKQYERERN